MFIYICLSFPDISTFLSNHYLH